MGGFSIWHILIFAVVAIVLLGGGRFSSMMGDVAKGIKSFKKGMAEDDTADAANTAPPSRIEGRPASPTLNGEEVPSADRRV
jgi:sec-independent protein translocase protein TatA